MGDALSEVGGAMVKVLVAISIPLVECRPRLSCYPEGGWFSQRLSLSQSWAFQEVREIQFPFSFKPQTN